VRNFLIISAICIGASTARAGRPSEAIEAERKSLGLEVELLRKKTSALEGSVDARQAHLRHRLRALYKISQGGYVRMLVSAESPAELFARRDGVRRIIHRDLDELSSVKSELADLEADRSRLRARERRAAELDASLAGTEPEPLERKQALYRPVGGAIVGAFGRYRDAIGIVATRDGVEIATRRGEPVRAVGGGEVTSVAELPGLGLAIVVDHGGGWVSLVARLTAPRVAPGSLVKPGDHLADAAGDTIQLQLSEEGSWIDPTAWLAR
jgi:septal ring factor EnvC (AmiA/AmiB activator)